MRGELLADFLHAFSPILHSTRAFFRVFNIKSYVYSFNVSDLFSHIQTVFNSSRKTICKIFQFEFPYHLSFRRRFGIRMHNCKKNYCPHITSISKAKIELATYRYLIISISVFRSHLKKILPFIIVVGSVNFYIGSVILNYESG